MVADSLRLRLVFLADNPGMMSGSRSESAGVLRSGARMFAAQTAATTLTLHVTLRKAYGFGSMVMSLLGFDELIDPRETRDALLAGLQRGLSSRQAIAEPVSRTVILP